MQGTQIALASPITAHFLEIFSRVANFGSVAPIMSKSSTLKRGLAVFDETWLFLIN